MTSPVKRSTTKTADTLKPRLKRFPGPLKFRPGDPVYHRQRDFGLFIRYVSERNAAVNFGGTEWQVPVDDLSRSPWPVAMPNRSKVPLAKLAATLTPQQRRVVADNIAKKIDREQTANAIADVRKQNQKRQDRGGGSFGVKRG